MEDNIEIILYGKKVNVNNWAKSHPGGKVILQAFHHRDATEQFEAMHSSEAKQQLFTTFLPKSPLLSSLPKTPAASAPLVVKSSLSVSASSSPLWAPNIVTTKAAPSLPIAPNKVIEDFLQFRKDMEAKGFFKTNVLMELLVAVYTLFMCIVGSYIFTFASYTWLGGVMMSLGLAQAGWVAHDYYHHAVMPTVWGNEFIGGLFALLQGYEGEWWKARHNVHHVATNEVLHDPDISIAPLLHFVQQYPDLKSTLKHIQKYQHIYYIPLLPLLDFDWRVESILHVKNNFKKAKFPAAKLLLHYMFVAYMVYIGGIYPIILISLCRGFITAVLVFSSHYTEKRYFDIPSLSLAEQTAYTTRNISGGAFMNFISGNISLQIEHHLFPTMPPHNLAKSTPYVKKFFADHNLPYHESSIFECVSRMVSSLNMHLTKPRQA